MTRLKTLYMETTEVPSIKTAWQISTLLVTSGARQIVTDYTSGAVTGLQFVLDVAGAPQAFSLPVRSERIYEALIERKDGYLDSSIKQRVRAQAERVAWRQVFRWVQAQLAFIDTGMVKPAEVFFPYLLQPGNNSLRMYEWFELQTSGKLLEGK